jgi:glycosyltransferase involved in cell wall biosynthesis
MLEAMACGCAIVTTETCEIPNIIKHGVNGFMSNDENELRKFTEQLLSDPDLAATMGAEARLTIEEKFSEQRFIEQWNNTFDKVHGVVK